MRPIGPIRDQKTSHNGQKPSILGGFDPISGNYVTPDWPQGGH